MVARGEDGQPHDPSASSEGIFYAAIGLARSLALLGRGRRTRVRGAQMKSSFRFPSTFILSPKGRGKKRHIVAYSVKWDGKPRYPV